MRHLGKSRRELFEAIDRPALKALPTSPFEFAEWKKARLNIDYHVVLDDHYYSAPYQLVHNELWIRATASIVEMFHRGNRVASHRRSYIKYKATTLPWAAKLGPHCAELVRAILESKTHPELGYRAALGIIRFEKKYGTLRVEKACAKAIAIQSPSYRTVRNILDNGVEDTPIPGLQTPTDPQKPKSVENIRGPHYFH